MNSGSYNNFLERFTEFKNDPTNDEDMAEREENYLLAQDLIDTPEKIRKLTEKDMFYLLTLFHSGGVERNEGKIAGDMSRFRMYLERALEISSDTTPAAYERAKDLLDSPDVDVSGAGINVRTEIFHTYDPVRFPVLNRNFEKGLLFFHFIESEFSGNKGERYYRCIKIVEEIRQQFSIPNCRELDWFFNYIYWENKRKTSPEEYRAYHQKKLQKKRDSKSKALKVKPETLQVFEMEYFSLKNLPESLISALQDVLGAYENSSTRSYAILYNAYKVLSAVAPSAAIKSHQKTVQQAVNDNLLFYGSKLNSKQSQIFAAMVKVFISDISDRLGSKKNTF